MEVVAPLAVTEPPLGTGVPSIDPEKKGVGICKEMLKIVQRGWTQKVTNEERHMQVQPNRTPLQEVMIPKILKLSGQ